MLFLKQVMFERFLPSACRVVHNYRVALVRVIMQQKTVVVFNYRKFEIQKQSAEVSVHFSRNFPKARDDDRKIPLSWWLCLSILRKHARAYQGLFMFDFKCQDIIISNLKASLR